MTKNEKLFSELEPKYLENYNRVNGKRTFLEYKNGFVFIGNPGDMHISKARINDFKRMTIAMEGRPDFNYKELDKKVAPFSFEGVAKKVTVGGEEEVSVWTDGVALSSDLVREYSAYRLEEGKKYKITIEQID